MLPSDSSGLRQKPRKRASEEPAPSESVNRLRSRHGLDTHLSGSRCRKLTISKA
jgi:hypothetical protein